MVNKWFFSLFLVALMSVNFVTAQQDTNFYRIQFTDKTNTPYDLLNPIEFLSSKAIARREKSGIPISTQDLPIDPDYISQVLGFSSVEYVTHSKWFNQLVIVCNDTNDINSINQLPFVLNNQQFSKPSGFTTTSSDKLEVMSPKETILVNPHYPYGITYAQNHLHHLDFMHDLSFNGQGIDIAIIDAGFQNVTSLDGLKHLFESGQILSTYDFVDLEPSVTEDHSHGSAVLSVIAGYIEGEFYGTAISANFHLLRSEDANAEYIIEEDFWTRAAEYADSAGADIINTSLGYSEFDDSTQNHSYSEMDGNTTLIARANDIASSKGILCITSAGNLGNSDWGYISTPADADSTLTIGAIDQYDQLADFSSFGPSADGEIKPNLVSVGWLTQLIAPWDNQIITGNGTSFSAPMTSGIAACLWQSLPDLNNIEIKSLLENSASQANSPDTLKGYGFPRVFEAYSSHTGITHKDPQGISIQKLFPNPALTTDNISILVSSEFDTEIELLVIDVLGRISNVQNSSINIGLNLLTLPNGFSVSKGVYTVVIQTNGSETIEKLVIH